MTGRVLAIGAHPDDIEFMMAGTLLLLRQAGWELHYLNVANGSCGSQVHDATTTARIRRQEAMAAAQFAGAVYHESRCADLEIFYDRDTLRWLASLVREVAPDIILTHGPEDYMEDHTNTCRLAVTAAFARGMPNFPVDPPRPPVDRAVALHHALPYGLRGPLGRPVVPGLVVDISTVMDAKRQMLGLHISQKEWLDASQGIDSYLQHMEDMAQEVGRLSGRFPYAEGWTRHLPLGLGPATPDPLLQALSPADLVVRMPMSAHK